MNRRQFNQALSVAGASLATMPLSGLYAQAPNYRPISGLSIREVPRLGMGTWITFDVGDDPIKRANCLEVLKTFFQRGGQLVDSSPMYGSAPDVIGYCLAQLRQSDPPLARRLFAASKVWRAGKQAGIDQISYQETRWDHSRFDLLQIHNMVNWHVQLETLQAFKAEGRIGHLGITTSHGRRENGMRLAMINERFDSVQLSYNMLDRQAERRLLPTAAEQGCAVIVNRPFQTGGLFRTVAGKPLPGIAADLGLDNWAQYFLAWVISHPVVTCAIPATSSVAHMQQNMALLDKPLPDAAARKAMLDAYLAMI